jgi:hypothetical protein
MDEIEEFPIIKIDRELNDENADISDDEHENEKSPNKSQTNETLKKFKLYKSSFQIESQRANHTRSIT